MDLEINLLGFISRLEKHFKYTFASFYLIIACHSVGIAQSVDHSLWDQLLHTHVAKNGNVNYNAFIKDSNKLNSYLRILEMNPPSPNWNRNEEMAFWINTYNAYTVKLILSNYPIKGIKEIGGRIPFVNSTWDIKFIKIGDELLDLNNIEHSKLRKKFNDPRIHMVLVCASKSCPALPQEAIRSSTLDSQLDQASIIFVNDPFKNSITDTSIQLSMIFKWYVMDFRAAGGVKAFVNNYSKKKLNDKTKIKYLNYDWSLNE